jgi:D-alanine transaminase
MTTTKILANWNGEIMPLDQVRVSVTDRGFLYSDAVYEVVQIYEGHLWLFNEHIDRLRHSLSEVGIRSDVDRLGARIVEMLKASGVRSGQVYVQVTGGVLADPMGMLPPPREENSVPNELIYIQAQDKNRFETQRNDGVAVTSYPDLRWGRRDIKSTNLLGNCLAAQAATAAGCFEAALVEKSGIITEGTKTNIFAVKDNCVLTSPIGAHILSGTTRGFVLRLLRDAGIPYREEPIRVEQVGNLDEMFLSGTGIEILGVARFDDRPVGEGRPGPVTKRIHREYARTVNEWLRSRRDFSSDLS